MGLLISSAISLQAFLQAATATSPTSPKVINTLLFFSDSPVMPELFKETVFVQANFGETGEAFREPEHKK